MFAFIGNVLSFLFALMVLGLVAWYAKIALSFTSFKEPSRTAQALREHEEILRLIAAKDYEGAARATSIHLRDSLETYLKLWRLRKAEPKEQN